MLQAIVVGNVWSTKRIDGLPSGAFLKVRVVESGDCLVAFDVLGSGVGERVLIAQGSVASGWLPDRPPVDALIIGSIDEPADTAPADTAPASTTPASTTPASTTPASTTPASTTPASTTPASQATTTAPGRNKAAKASRGSRSGKAPGSAGATR